MRLSKTAGNIISKLSFYTVVSSLFFIHSSALAQTSSIQIQGTIPSEVNEGDRIDFELLIQNTGSQDWDPISTLYCNSNIDEECVGTHNTGEYQYRLNAFKMDTADPFSNRYDFTFPLGEILAPGESIEVQDHFYANLPPGVYDIYPTTVKRGVCFFGETGCWGSFAGVWNDAFFFTLVVSESTELVASYPFSGNANDQSGNGNDLDVFGAVLAEDRFGNPNSAYQFDGINDYLYSSFDTSNDNTFTWTFWLQDQSTTPSIRRWLSTNNGVLTPGTVFIRENFAASGGLQVATGFLDYSEGELVKGSWTHYAVVSDGSSTKVYVNGVQETGNSVGAVDPESGFFVGGWFTGAPARPEFFNGLIDDIQLFNGSLSQAEVEDNYLSGAPPPNSPPVISGLAEIEVFEGEELSVLYFLDDSDGEVVDVFVLGDAPLPDIGAEWEIYDNNAELLLRFLPPKDSAGSYTITLSATDDGDAESTTEVHVTVKPAPLPVINGPSEITGLEGQALTEIYTIGYEILFASNSEIEVSLAGQTESDAVPIGMTINYSAVSGEGLLAWSPSYSASGNAYYLKIIAETPIGYRVEKDIVVTVGDVSSTAVLLDIEESVAAIPLSNFKGKNAKSQSNSRKYISKKLENIGSEISKENYKKALDQLVLLVTKIDNNLVSYSNSSDKMNASEEQEILLRELFVLGKVVSSEAHESGIVSPPLVLVHGLRSTSETWNSFIENSGFVPAGNIEIGFDTTTNEPVIIKQEFKDISFSETGFLIYTVDLSDGDGRWDDVGLQDQGMMLGSAIARIKAHSMNSKVVLAGHSMGGLSIRSYLRQSSNPAEDVMGYLTVGTPHLGVKLDILCSIVTVGSGQFVEDLCSAGFYSHDAIADLDFGSAAISQIYGNTSSELEIDHPLGIDFRFALATVYNVHLGSSDVNVYNACLSDEDIRVGGVSLTDLDYSPVLTDLIVPLFSQLANFCDGNDISEDDLHIVPSELIYHMQQTSNINVINRLIYEYWEKAAFQQ